MPNNCLSVLYKRIIQVENKNVGLKVGGHKHTIAPPPPNQKSGRAHAPLATPLPTPVINCFGGGVAFICNKQLIDPSSKSCVIKCFNNKSFKNNNVTRICDMN